MAIPAAVAGSLVSGGLGLLGGALSNSFNSSNARRQEMLQREFAQYGIRWRVEDAKAAGLHPLYALGAQIPAYSPSFATDSVGPALANAGQDVGRAIAAQQTASQRQAEALALRLAESQIKETDARALLARAETLRTLRDSGPGFPPVNMPEAALIGETAATTGGATLRAPDVTMTRPESSAIVAGPAAPFFREYVLPGGVKFVLPAAQDLGEALEPLGESTALLMLVARENMRLYGPERTRDILNRLVGETLTNVAMGRPPRFRPHRSDQERRADEHPFIFGK